MQRDSSNVLASVALSTCWFAITALHQTGQLHGEAASWRRGIEYLLQSQQPDGSRHVESRAKPIQEYFETGFPHGKDQFISAFATGWATEALVISLDENKGE